MDAGSKLNRKVALTMVAPHDSTVLEDLMSEDELCLFVDKAYARDGLKQIASDKGWYHSIMDKSKLGDPLSFT